MRGKEFDFLRVGRVGSARSRRIWPSDLVGGGSSGEHDAFSPIAKILIERVPPDATVIFSFEVIGQFV